MTGSRLSRRQFLWSAGVIGGGLVVGVALVGTTEPAPAMAPVADAFVPNAFLQITPDNVVRFYCPRDEMGQGVSTGLATLIAEELDVAPQRIDVVFAGVHSDYDNPEFGVQATGGSTSIRGHYYPLRQAAADARAALITAAAGELGLSASALATDDGHIVANAMRHPYGRFAASAARLTLPSGTPLKAKRRFKYIGAEFPRLDGLAKSTGTAVFGIDVELPGLHYAVVRHGPVTGARLRSFDASRASSMPGVTDIVAVSSGVAVVASQFWQAKRAADALSVDWEASRPGDLDSTTLRAEYAAAIDSDDGTMTAERGDVTMALRSSSTRIDSDYWTPYLAHAPMEPMNAVVRIDDDGAELWVGSQSPGVARGLVAHVAGLDKAAVRVHSTFLGGGFGRRSALSHVTEATEIALAAKKPIKLIWTREDDMRNGVFRPASLMRIRAGVDQHGIVSAWHATRVGANVFPDAIGETIPSMLPVGAPEILGDWLADAAEVVFDRITVDPTSVEGLAEGYDFPNCAVRHLSRDDGLPVAYWRSVGHSHTAFAKECAVDELAHASGIDPVELRLRNTTANPRLNKVIRLAGERMRSMQIPPGHGLGMAAHRSFETDVAQVAQVSLDDGVISVHKVLCVVDCGQVVNPDIVRAQMEGAIMYGLTAALYGDLAVEGGAIRQSNFHDYLIVRMHEAPAVEVVIVDSDEDPSGVGEPGLPPIAPAVANALYAASGIRARSLPLRLDRQPG